MRSRRPLAALVAVAALLAPLAACSSDGSDATSTTTAVDGAGTTGTDAGDAEDGDAVDVDPASTVPGDEWEEATPEELGLDPAVLDDVAEVAEANDSTCFLVVRHGKLAGEWYFQGTEPDSAQEVFSATKSFASTLVGIAQADGDLDVGDSASAYIPEWKGTPAEAVTVEDLLSNDSGRHWDFDTDYSKLLQAPDMSAFAIGLAQDDPPGEVWAYNNSAIQTLEQVLQVATGEQMDAFGQERLLDPIGMADSTFSTDQSGNGLAFMGLQSTCRDMARFGQLILDRGRWGDEEIVPEAWVEAATGQASQDLNAGYGYLWWLNLTGPQASAVSPLRLEEVPSAESTQRVEGAPEDLVWALGLGGQTIQIHEETDTVVVRLGSGDIAATFGPAETARIVTEAITGDGEG